MNRHHDVVAITRQRLIDRVIHHFKHKVVQPCSVGRVADVHAGALAHRFQSFEDLDTSLAIGIAALGAGTPIIVRAALAIRMILGSCHCVVTLAVYVLALDCRTGSTLALHAQAQAGVASTFL